MNHIAQVFQDQFLSPTLQDLLDKIQYHTFRAYSYDTSPKDQDKIISKLRERGLTVRVISNFETIKKWPSFDVDVLIIKNTGAIINNLDNLKPFEDLLASDTKFIIFFNAGIDVQIDSREKRDRWKALADNSKYCYEISFKKNTKPQKTRSKPTVKRDTVTLTAVVKDKTSQYLRETFRSLFRSPWTPLRFSIIVLLILILLDGLISILTGKKFWPIFLASLFLSPLAILVGEYTIKTSMQKYREGIKQFFIFILLMSNLFLGLTILAIVNFIIDLLEN